MVWNAVVHLLLYYQFQILLNVLLYSLRSYMSSSADSSDADLRANVDTKLLALDVLSLVLRELCLIILQASPFESDPSKTRQVRDVSYL